MKERKVVKTKEKVNLAKGRKAVFEEEEEINTKNKYLPGEELLQVRVLDVYVITSFLLSRRTTKIKEKKERKKERKKVRERKIYVNKINQRLNLYTHAHTKKISIIEGKSLENVLGIMTNNFEDLKTEKNDTQNQIPRERHTPRKRNEWKEGRKEGRKKERKKINIKRKHGMETKIVKQKIKDKG